MNYPDGTGQVLQAMFPGADLFGVCDQRKGKVHVTWDDSIGALPSVRDVEQILAGTKTLPNGQTLSEWGDPTKAARRQAKAALDATDPATMAAKAYALERAADVAGTKTDAELRAGAKVRIDRGEVG